MRNKVLEQVESVKATGYADEVIIEDYVGQKIDDIQKYNVDIFAIGSDWEGIFDYLNEFTEVVYLPLTEGISSTILRYEIQEFISCIVNKRFSTARLRRRESVCMAEVMRQFVERKNFM